MTLTQPMDDASADAPAPFTQPWADRFRDAVNADPDYRAAAGGWTWPVAMVLERAPHLGYPDDVAVQLELDRGRCHGAAVIPPSAVTAPFSLRAPYATWKLLVTGALDPMTAVTFGKVKLTGSLATLMMHVKAARALVACVRAVPTTYPDEEQG